MKRVMAALILLLLVSGVAVAATGTRETPFTLDDRDRLIRLDVRIDAVEKRMDGIEKRMDGIEKRIDDLEKRMDKRFDEMRIFMLWGFGILFGGIGILMTTVIWDRRTALAPVIRRNDEYGERIAALERILKEKLL
ncbi:MAG: hypothetical protein HQK99_13565 [Nitrospirae bacterium]|nr:hypothetical protein [Nitrospirota bacterium]